MNNQQNRILLFTGNGKGKTTAALGIVLRCFGHEMPVAIIQFIKSQETTGEAKAIGKMAGVDLFLKGEGFVLNAQGNNLAKHRAAALNGLDCACRVVQEAKHKVIVLDEVCVAVHKELITEDDVLQLIAESSPDTMFVMTGRYATPALIDIADTVTEMTEVKHGLKAGIKAQVGIEK